ncbi:MAG: hypothetical protein M1821_003851 [Bathelium mastoideum]|nr:MAG: hypothetical protein M1821_003851 [Bathelium mastoideum]
MSEQSLTWVPQTVKPRAKAISEDEWNKHKEELCNLYREKTVKEVQSHMDEVHGFHASRKQYVSRFQKWGMRKYQEPDLASVDGNVLANEAFVPRHVCEASNALGMEFSTNAEATPLKRTLPSSFSSERIQSRRGPSKLAKEGEEDIFRLPFHHHEETDSRADASPFTTSPDQPPHCGDYFVLPTEDCEEWAREPGPVSFEELSRMDDTIGQGSRELSTFSKLDIRKIKFAADLLRSIDHADKAFRLYTILLKFLRSSASATESMVTWTSIACVTSASTTPQFEISRVLLEKRLDELSGRDDLHELFLLHRLLAMIHGQMGDTKRHDLSMQIAYSFLRPSAIDRSAELALLPGHRLLKLYIYFYIEIDCKYDFYHIELPSAGLNKERVSPAIQDALLYRGQGCMEVQEDAVQNQCLRSCVEWCHNALPREARHDNKKFLSPTTVLDSQLGLDVLYVFLRLWKLWQREREHSAKLALWMTHSEKLMGISPCEVLRVTIRMCIDQELPENRSLGIELYQIFHNSSMHLTPPPFWWARAGASVLFSTPGEQLFRRFLEAFKKVFKEEQTKPSRMCVLKTVERNASVIENYQQNVVKSSSQHNLPQELPPLARSLQSSQQYSSFRALATRIREKPRDTGSRPKKPSSVLRRSLVADFTIEGFSFLCESFRSSLSLSSSSSKRSLDRKHLQSQVQEAVSAKQDLQLWKTS